MATGLTNSDYKYIEEKIVAFYNEDGKLVYNIGGFIGKEYIQGVQENEYLKVDIKDQIIYIPRGESSSTETLKNMIEKNNLNSEIRRIDSISMSQIIQEYDNCVGEANTTYLKKEIENKLFTVLDTDFKIPSLEIGIYYKKDNNSKELKNLIKIIRKNFNK